MKKISILLLVIVAALTSCKKVPEVNTEYVDVERDLITVGMTTATVQCDYQYIATLKKAYFYYGEGEDEADMNTAEMRVLQNTLYVDLADLKPNTLYSYYYEFYNGFNSMRTALKTFKTEAGNGGGDEPPTPPEITLPTVITVEVSGITTNAAQCGGEVVNDGGTEVTERGICWSANANPTLNDSHIASGTGIGAFTAIMNNLAANSTYHVRAYAINEVGTAYGLDKEFTTLSGGGGGVPEGAINGLFTINDNGDKVYFSQGNLQYQASTNTWRFALNQWNYVGGEIDGCHYGNVIENGIWCYNELISSTYNGWIDLYGWGTSGYDHGAVCYQPWSTSQIEADYLAYGYYLNNLYDQTGKADWGYNSISNGGNTTNQWRTLTVSEWNYVFNNRSTSSDIRYAKARVNNVNGIILLPDDWNSNTYYLNNINTSDVAFSNSISADQWVILENAGAVFLPAAGSRVGTTVLGLTVSSSQGGYWSASNSSSVCAYGLYFDRSTLTPFSYLYNYRYRGHSVRLVQDANP